MVTETEDPGLNLVQLKGTSLGLMRLWSAPFDSEAGASVSRWAGGGTPRGMPETDSNSHIHSNPTNTGNKTGRHSLSLSSSAVLIKPPPFSVLFLTYVSVGPADVTRRLLVWQSPCPEVGSDEERGPSRGKQTHLSTKKQPSGCQSWGWGRRALWTELSQWDRGLWSCIQGHMHWWDDVTSKVRLWTPKPRYLPLARRLSF